MKRVSSPQELARCRSPLPLLVQRFGRGLRLHALSRGGGRERERHRGATAGGSLFPLRGSLGMILADWAARLQRYESASRRPQKEILLREAWRSARRPRRVMEHCCGGKRLSCLLLEVLCNWAERGRWFKAWRVRFQGKSRATNWSKYLQLRAVILILL